MHGENPGQPVLRLVASLLIAAGLATGLGGLLFQVVREFARDCWWMAVTLCLLVALRNQPWNRIARAGGLLMLLIWLNFNFDDLAFLVEWISYRIADDFLGVMLTVLGVLILLTNDPQGKLPCCFRRWLSLTTARRKTAVAVCVMGLWIVNPENSHALCLRAADACETVGANSPAILFARLARDTFPPETFCLTCHVEMRDDLSWRIARLRAGERIRPPVTATTVGEMPGPDVPAIGRPAGE